MVFVAIIGQRHSEEFWFGPGLHVTRLATMKGKHHGGVYPATVSVSVGYNFFSPICLFTVFVITLWQVSQAGEKENGRTTNSLVYSQTTWPVRCLWKASEINGD